MTSFLLAVLFLVQVPAQLQTQTGVVTGILRTDSGLPLEGVRVAVTPADPSIAGSVLESLGLTDSSGRYRLENVSPGRYSILIGRERLPIYHPGVAELGKATTIQVTAGSTIDVPDMVFGGNHVTGRVVDMATGKGRRIGKLLLCCDYSHPVLIANQDTPVAAGTVTTTTSEDGSFVFPSIPPGNYVLSAADPSVLPVSWPIAVEKNVTELQLEVTEGVSVQGTILDQTGKPVTAFIQLRPASTNSAFNIMPTYNSVGGPVSTKGNSSLTDLRDRLFKSARVDSETLHVDGRFTFQKVYPGAYVLDVTATGVNLLHREIQVGTVGVMNLSLAVPAIQVSGRVIATSGGPLPKLNYIRLVRSGSDGDVFYAFPDAEGHFSSTLLPGPYRVFTERLGPSVQSVSDGSRDITNTEFTVEGNLNPQIVVTLEP